MFERRGQAAAPFELFVAVIIMTFVVIVGYQALTKVTTEVCLNSVDKAMSDFKTSLEGTVKMKSQNKLFFHPEESCFISKQTIMKIEVVSERQVCAARCGSPMDTCFVMTFSNPNIANAFKQKCLELPPYTNFDPDMCAGAVDSELSGQGYSPIRPMEAGQIGIGSYVFKNISPAGDTYPKVCIFYKK